MPKTVYAVNAALLLALLPGCGKAPVAAATVAPAFESADALAKKKTEAKLRAEIEKSLAKELMEEEGKDVVEIVVLSVDIQKRSGDWVFFQADLQREFEDGTLEKSGYHGVYDARKRRYAKG